MAIGWTHLLGPSQRAVPPLPYSQSVIQFISGFCHITISSLFSYIQSFKLLDNLSCLNLKWEVRALGDVQDQVPRTKFFPPLQIAHRQETLLANLILL